MKKFQSFEDVNNYLHTEEIPYTDNKQEILKSIEVKAGNHRIGYKKVSFVCTVIFILIMTVAFTFGYIKEHECFVKAHNGIIKDKLIDNNGNIVVQVGIMDPENYAERRHESEQRDIVSDKFADLSKSLEDKLPDDKVAVFIPVKDLESFIDLKILNSYENYYTIEDMKKNIPSSNPLPKYIPKGFDFSKALVFYDYEDFHAPYEDKMTYKEFLEKQFNEAKTEGKGYYYKEYGRFNEIYRYILEYKTNNFQESKLDSTQILHLSFKKGKTTVLQDSGTSELPTEIIEYNGRKYLKDDMAYYTYVYIDDELWTIEIGTGQNIDEISKIIDSIE